MEFTQIAPNHFPDLKKLFSRNNIPEITTTFRPFDLSEEIADSIAHSTGQDKFFLAYFKRTAIGFSMLRGWDEGYDIPSFGMFVDHAHQNKGFGREILKRTIEEAVKASCKSVRLSVFESNVSAHHIYTQLGFVETSRSEVKRDGIKDNRIIMQKELNEFKR